MHRISVAHRIADVEFHELSVSMAINSRCLKYPQLWISQTTSWKSFSNIIYWTRFCNCILEFDTNQRERYFRTYQKKTIFSSNSKKIKCLRRANSKRIRLARSSDSRICRREWFTDRKWSWNHIHFSTFRNPVSFSSSRFLNKFAKISNNALSTFRLICFVSHVSATKYSHKLILNDEFLKRRVRQKIWSSTVLNHELSKKWLFQHFCWRLKFVCSASKIIMSIIANSSSSMKRIWVFARFLWLISEWIRITSRFRQWLKVVTKYIRQIDCLHHIIDFSWFLMHYEDVSLSSFHVNLRKNFTMIEKRLCWKVVEKWVSHHTAMRKISTDSYR